jgi:phage portal protein BeeE
MGGARAAAAAVAVVEQRFASTWGSWLLTRRGDDQLLEAYGENPWLLTVQGRRAEAVAVTQWTLFQTKKARPRAQIALAASRVRAHGLPSVRAAGIAALVTAGAADQLVDHPLLTLLRNPAPGFDGFAFWELVSVYFDIVGEVLLVMEGDRDANGIRTGPPRWLNVVKPTQIQQRPEEGQPFFTVRTAKGVEKVGIMDAIWIRRLNPADPYRGRGIGTGHSLRDELAIDEAMAMTARARFKNRASPDFMFALTSGQTNMPAPGPEAVKKFVMDFEQKHRGTERAGGVHAFGGDVKAVPLSGSLVENQYIQGRQFNRDTVMQAHGAPPELFGVLDNANRSTIDAALDHFARLSTVPFLERLVCALENTLVPEFGTDLVLGYVNPIPADRDFEKSIVVALPGAFTINDIRSLAGFAPRDDGNQLYTAPGAVPVPGDAPKLPAKKKEKANAPTELPAA